MNCAAKVVFGSLLLSSLASGQVLSAPSASVANSSIVSPAPDNNIEPVRGPSNSPLDSESVADPASLLPDLPPVIRAKATLVGGTVERLDRLRDQVTLRVFGGGRMNVWFDPRTRVYQGGVEATIADLQEGQRVYFDTILDGNTVFARTIRIKAAPALGEGEGIVLKYRSDRGELTIRDAISPAPVSVRLSSSTRFLQGDRVVAANTLVAGCLVAVKFSSEGNDHDVAREISILALPGTQYTFVGEVVHVDLRTGLLVINSSTDRKTYEVYLDPSTVPDERLHAGAIVTVVAKLDGSRYLARNLTIDSQGK